VKIIPILILILLASCKQSIKQNEFFGVLKDSLIELSIENLNISKLKKIKRNSSIQNTEHSDWLINENGINNFLEIAVIISDAELHHLYNQEEFSYEGEIKYKNEVYEFEINAGGWMDILNKKNNSTILLGCNLIPCEKIFISRGISQYE